MSLPIGLNLIETAFGMQSWIGWPYPSPGAMAEIPWQMMPTLIFGPFLTVVALAWLQRTTGRFRRVIACVTPYVLSLLVVNTLIWCWVWFPRFVNEAAQTPPATVATLNQVAADLPSTSEVVASLGVVGRLAERRYIFLTVFGSADTVIPLRTPTTYFVLTPVTGQESNEVNLDDLTSFLLQQPNAQLLVHRNNVWVFAYHRRPNQKLLNVEYGSSDIVGAAVPPGPATATINWPAQNCLSSNAHASGNLFSQFRVALAPGRYALELEVEGSTHMLAKVGRCLEADGSRWSPVFTRPPSRSPWSSQASFRSRSGGGPTG
jgi:hypothetical protein